MKAHRFTQKAHTGAESNNFTFSAKGAYNAFKRQSGGEKMKSKYPTSKKELPKNKTDGIKQGGVMHGRAQKNK